MTHRLGMAFAGALLVIAAECVLPSVSAQSVPRDSSSRADLSGVWMRADLGRLQSDPPPYNVAAQARHDELRKRSGVDDPMSRCLAPGVPRIWTMPAPFKIIQLRDEVVILYEMFSGIRIVPTDGRGDTDDEPRFYGTSAGHWDGDTLVIDVRNFTDKTWLGLGGTHHSDQMRIVERLRRTGPTALSYEATVTDPVVFTKPWIIRHTFELRPGERLREYVCEETAADHPAASVPRP